MGGSAMVAGLLLKGSWCQPRPQGHFLNDFQILIFRQSAILKIVEEMALGTRLELVFKQEVFLPSPCSPPLAHFVNPLPGPDLAVRIQDGDLITNSIFFPPSNRLRAG